VNNKIKIEYENEIRDIYTRIKPDIVKRIKEFRKIWSQADNEELFIELSFCLFTPQSGARQCWKAVNRLLDKNLLFHGTSEEIAEEINIVRFRNNKSRYLIEAREKFTSEGSCIRGCLDRNNKQSEKREWLVKNVKGMGYKEASHFLRNIGIGNHLAILDRHILKNMVLLGIIDEIPKSINNRIYLELEDKLKTYSVESGIPLEHLDFVLWYKEAGEIFK
jgi:N-glycosylase/DNA lyase